MRSCCDRGGALRRKLLLVVALLVASCKTNPQTGESQVNFYTPEEEIVLGREAAPEIEEEFGGLYEDPATQEYVDHIVRRLAQSAKSHRYPFSGRVLDSHVLNAFSLPGGPVYITRGLLIRMKDESQLAGVLGHEVAHIAGQHGVNRISEVQLSQALIAVGAIVAYTQAEGDDKEYVVYGAAMAAAINTLYHLGHSRDHEYESDTFGAEYSYQNAYDPRSLGQVFQIFKAYRREVGGGDEPEWLQTHPKDDNRIREIEKLYAEKYSKPRANAYVYNQPEFEKATAQLRRDQDALAKHDKAKGHIAHKQFAGALPLLDEAIQAAPHYSSFHIARGEALEGLGRRPEALEAYGQAAKVNPKNHEARRLYGQALAGGGRHDDAVRELEAAVGLAPTCGKSHQSLSSSLGALGRKGYAKKEAAKAKALIDASAEGRKGVR